MDKKLLDSLNNLSLALEDIAASLKSKSEAQSATAKAMKGGDFVKEIKEINVGVKQLLKDSKQILANQQTLMKMGKSKNKGADATETLGKDKQKQKFFKEGIGVILLIAVAVLALGVAFRLIGKVNFLSVIALSIALPLLAIGFSKVHRTLKETGFDAKKDGKNFVLAITAISLGITLSSWILSMVSPLTFTKMFTVILLGAGFALLSPAIYRLLMAFKGMSFMALVKSVIFLPLVLPAIALGIAFASWAFQLVKPVGFSQMFTTIFIAIAFTIISFGIRKLLKAFKGIGPLALVKAVEFLPLILPAIALGIALSSYALQLVKPISLSQFFTTVFIALAFTIISYGLNKLISAFKKMKPAEAMMAAFMIPILLVAISYAIAFSSYALSTVKPISFIQFLTALGVAIIFVVIAFAVSLIDKAIKKLKWPDIVKIPLLFTLISVAIMLSSHILSKAKPIPFMTMLKIAIFSVVLAIAVIAVGFAMFVLSKMKVKVKDAIMGGLLMVIISLAIMLSSHILALGNYKKYPDWKWSLGVALSMIAFIPAIMVLGSIAMSGVGALALLAGAGMVLIVALAVMATSHILAKGKYDKFPPLKWTLGVVACMVPFALMTVILGGIAMTGIGLIAMGFGVGMVLSLAYTIVETSNILSKGTYDNKGMLGWALSTVLLFSTFAPLILVLGAIGVAAAALSFFFGDGANPFEAGRGMLKDIAWSIVDVSYILSHGKYVGGPTKAWAEGVGIAIGAFSPVYSMLVANAVLEAFGSGGVGPDDFARAIRVVSYGIIIAAEEFSKHSAAFKNGPPKKWATGVGQAIGAFAPVFVALNENTGWFTTGEDVVSSMVMGIIAITRGIISAAEILAENKAPFESYPSKKWGQGVGEALKAFNPVFKALHEDTGWFTSGEDVVRDMRYGIEQIAYALTNAAWAFSGLTPEMWGAYPTVAWAKGVSNSVTGFMDLFDTIDERGYSVTWFSIMTQILTGALNSLSFSAWIMYSARKAFTFKINPDWMKNLSKNVLIFGWTAMQLDKMLGYDEKTTSKSGGIMGFGGSTTTTTTRKMKDISIIPRIVYQMTEVGWILFLNKKVFDAKLTKNVTDWTYNLGKSVLFYAGLSRVLENILTIEETKSISFGTFMGKDLGGVSWKEKRSADVGIINRTVNQIVQTAGILWWNRKYFQFKLDPNYMKRMGRNIMDFADIVRYLNTDDTLQSGGFLSNLLGMDPVSRSAQGMVKMASAFDTLAKSLNKFSSAIKSIDGQKVNMIRKLTANIAILSAMDSKMFNNMLTVLEKRSGVFAKLLDVQGRSNDMKARPSVGDRPGGGASRDIWKKKSVDQGPTDAKGENALVKLDRIADLLVKINKNTSGIDDYIAFAQGHAKKIEKSMKKQLHELKEDK